VSASDAELIIPRQQWLEQRQAYRTRLQPWVTDRLRRGSRGEKHPVYDFLFEYYSFPATHLLRWSPGVGIALERPAAEELDWPRWFVHEGGRAWLPASAFPCHRLDFLRWASDFLETTLDREPFFGCFGLHEWAMVYQEEQVRHPQVPLRLSRAEINAVVEAGTLRCTHYDAFRFFTPAAVPLNRIALTRVSTLDHDQPGCLHVTMDLYRFAYKIAPFSSSAVLADAFDLARSAREIDMRASPYDLSAFGFTPIPIESRSGRDEYVAAQRELAARAVPIRQELLCQYRRLLRKRLANMSQMSIPSTMTI